MTLKLVDYRILLVVGVILVGWLGHMGYENRRARSNAKETESVACGTEADPVGCRARLDAHAAACFKLTYTPASSSKYGPRTPAHLDAAGYRECVRTSPEEWDRKDREARKKAREEERNNRNVLQ